MTNTINHHTVWINRTHCQNFLTVQFCSQLPQTDQVNTWVETHVKHTHTHTHILYVQTATQESSLLSLYFPVCILHYLTPLKLDLNIKWDNTCKRTLEVPTLDNGKFSIFWPPLPSLSQSLHGCSVIQAHFFSWKSTYMLIWTKVQWKGLMLILSNFRVPFPLCTI